MSTLIAETSIMASQDSVPGAGSSAVPEPTHPTNTHAPIEARNILQTETQTNPTKFWLDGLHRKYTLKQLQTTNRLLKIACEHRHSTNVLKTNDENCDVKCNNMTCGDLLTGIDFKAKNDKRKMCCLYW